MEIYEIFNLLRKYHINEIDQLINSILVIEKPEYNYKTDVLISAYNALINTLKQNVDFVKLHFSDYNFIEYNKLINPIEEYLDSIRIIFCLTQK